MKKFAMKHTIKPGHNRVAKTYGKSNTVPNQSYTVKELIEMNKKGISPAIMKEALYEMDDFGEELNPLRAKNFDLSDIDAIQRAVKKHQVAIEAKEKKERLKKEELDRKAIIAEYIAKQDQNNDGILDPNEKSSSESAKL